MAGTTLKDLETTNEDLDRWGIRKLYPDAAGDKHQEWYMNEEKPTSDPQFQNWKNAGLVRMQDGSGSFYVDGSGTDKAQVRLEGWSKKGTYWLDGEVTCYVKYLRDIKGKKKGDYAAQLYLRGGHHSRRRGQGGDGSCYKARLYKDGNTAIVKEIQHSPEGYANNRPGMRIIDKGDITNKWLGMKIVVYNFQEKDNGRVWVKVEFWVNVDCMDKNGNIDLSKQTWIKAAETVDKGNWKGMSKPTKWPSVDVNSKTPKVRQPDEIITKPGGTKNGNLGALRTDSVAIQFRYFSIREIQAPRKD
jgi:hypothetical protein